jgi:hypothetical protein
MAKKKSTGEAKPLLSEEEAQKILARDSTNEVKSAVEKALKGRPLTKKQKGLIARFANEPAPAEEWVSSYEKLGKILGLHRASFPRIVKQYPEAPRPRANGEHHVPAWQAFLKEHPDIECRSGPASTLKDALDQEKLRALKRENDAADGLLVNKDLVIDSNRRVAAALKNILRKLLNEMPGAVAGKDIPQAREYGGRLYDDLMREIAGWEKEWPA